MARGGSRKGGRRFADGVEEEDDGVQDFDLDDDEEEQSFREDRGRRGGRDRDEKGGGSGGGAASRSSGRVSLLALRRRAEQGRSHAHTKTEVQQSPLLPLPSCNSYILSHKRMY